MLWIKSFHIIFVASWFAGLFYLPRIFVNLAAEDNPQAYQRLLLMAGKLYRFTTFLSLPAIGFGLWLWLFYGIGIGSLWMLLKLIVVVLVIAYHHYCGRLLKKFEIKGNRHSHVWYRYFNEMPVLALVAAVILVVVKPF